MFDSTPNDLQTAYEEKKINLMFFFNVGFWGKVDFFSIVTQSIVIGKILIINAIHLIETLEYLIENLRGIQNTVILSNNQEKKI